MSERRSTSTAAQARQVEADHAVVVAAQRLDPADHAGAAAEGDNRNALRRAELQNAFHLVRVGRQHHGVRRRIEPAGAQAGEIDVAAAGGVAQAVLGAGEDVLLPDGLDQRWAAAPGPAAARSQSSSGERRCRPQLADPLAQRLQRRPVELGRDRRVPPPPPLRVAARPAHVSARSSPSSASSSSAPCPRRIIGEPSRERPRSVWAAASVTAVPPSVVAQGRPRPRSGAGGARTACPGSAAPSRSARPRRLAMQRKSARTPRPSAVPSTLVHCRSAPSPSTLSTRIVRGHQRARL